MSLFDIFRRKKSTATPNPNAERGDWKDWFLDMENRGPFRKNRTVKPEPDAERGDWMKWFLNREGLAGKFNADPGGYIDYTPWISFNGGGYAQSGPKRRQKLQPRNENVLYNLSDRYYEARNVEGMRRVNQELQDRIQNHPSMQPGTGFIFPGRPEEGRGGVGQDSFWNVKANQPDQSGIMLTLADNPAVNRIQNIYNRAANNPTTNRVKNIYNMIDPFLPEVDWGDKKVGYDYNRDLWGGNLNIGGEYDFDDDEYKAGINWGKNF